MNRFNKTSLKILSNNIYLTSIRNMTGELGSGVGKGGGAGGSIREAGGAFGKIEAAREEEFFRRQSQERLEKLRASLQLQQIDIEKQIQQHDADAQLRASNRNMSDESGSKSGSSAPDVSGKFGKAESAREEEHFHRESRKGLEQMRDSLKLQQEEIEKQILKHEAELTRLGEIQ